LRYTPNEDFHVSSSLFRCLSCHVAALLMLFL
jgi:hypothetical protein